MGTDILCKYQQLFLLTCFVSYNTVGFKKAKQYRLRLATTLFTAVYRSPESLCLLSPCSNCKPCSPLKDCSTNGGGFQET